jgi:ankyrin repeat protein
MHSYYLPLPVSQSGSTALIHASESGHLGAVETLLRKGAAVGIANQVSGADHF